MQVFLLNWPLSVYNRNPIEFDLFLDFTLGFLCAGEDLVSEPADEVEELERA